MLEYKLRTTGLCRVRYDDDDDDDDNNNNNNNNNNNTNKSLTQSLKRLDLHPNTYIQMQKSVILGTFSIVRNFLNYK
jgi:hypothetical protein